MRDFPPPQPGDRLGALMNLVRDRLRTVQRGQTVKEVLDLIGEPDFIRDRLEGWLPDTAENQVNSLGSQFFQASKPIADETLVYVNPYRQGLTHQIAISDGKVVRVWEVRTDPSGVTSISEY